MTTTITLSISDWESCPYSYVFELIMRGPFAGGNFLRMGCESAAAFDAGNSYHLANLEGGVGFTADDLPSDDPEVALLRQKIIDTKSEEGRSMEVRFVGRYQVHTHTFTLMCCCQLAHCRVMPLTHSLTSLHRSSK